MWERATAKEGGSGDTEQTWSQRRFVRLRADCDVLTTRKTGQFPHSTVELTPNKPGIYSERSAVGSRIIDEFQEKNVEMQKQSAKAEKWPSKSIPLTCNDPLGLIRFHVAIVLTGDWSEIGFWPVIQSCIEWVRVICVTSQRSRW